MSTPIQASDSVQPQQPLNNLGQTSIPATGVTQDSTFIGDQVVVSAGVEISTASSRYYLADSPQVGLPTTKAKERLATKEAVIKEATQNQWFANPNKMGAFYSAFINYMNNLSLSRGYESEMKRTIETGMFKAGMESANLAKEARDLEATKELTKAVFSIATGVMSIGQAAVLAQERGKTKSEFESTEHKSQQDIQTEQKKLYDLQSTNDLTVTEKTAPADIETAFNTKSTGEQQEIKDQKKVLQKAKDRQYAEFNDETRLRTTILETKFRGLNSLSDGMSGVMSAIMTKEQGKVDKVKAQLDTMVQFWSKMADAIRSDKDNDYQGMMTVNQILEKFLSATPRASPRG